MRTNGNAKTIFNSWNGNTDDGITKREQFALQAMESMIRRSSNSPDEHLVREFAQLAVAAADTLIQELNKEKK